MSKIEKALKNAQARGQLVVLRGEKPDGRVEANDTSRSAQRDLAARSGRSIARRSVSVGSIGKMKEPALRSHHELAQAKVISSTFLDNPTVRAMREIRSKILSQTGGQNAVVLVSAIVPKGGSSFVAFNLASAFAFDAGQTALLVDCNLHDPMMPKIFDEKEHLGLSDYLADPGMVVEQIVHPVGIERLRAIPAGTKPGAAGEQLASLRMRGLIEGLVERYAERFVILDGPPLTEAADVSALAKVADLVLLVVPYGRITDAQIAESMKDLPADKVVGFVINNEPAKPPFTWHEVISGWSAWARDFWRNSKSN